MSFNYEMRDIHGDKITMEDSVDNDQNLIEFCVYEHSECKTAILNKEKIKELITALQKALLEIS
jgi:hypothetical protein